MSRHLLCTKMKKLIADINILISNTILTDFFYNLFQDTAETIGKFKDEYSQLHSGHETKSTGNYYQYDTFYECNAIQHYLLPFRIRRVQCDVQAVRNTISPVFVSLFPEMEIISFATEIAHVDKVKTDLLDAHAIVETANNKHKRLVNTTTQFFEPLRKLKLGIFSSM